MQQGKASSIRGQKNDEALQALSDWLMSLARGTTASSNTQEGDVLSTQSTCMSRSGLTLYTYTYNYHVYALHVPSRASMPVFELFSEQWFRWLKSPVILQTITCPNQPANQRPSPIRQTCKPPQLLLAPVSNIISRSLLVLLVLLLFCLFIQLVRILILVHPSILLS